MKRKHQLKYIYYKKKGNAFGFQVVGYNLVERMEMCIDLISSGVVSIKGDTIFADKDHEDAEKDPNLKRDNGGNHIKQ